MNSEDTPKSSPNSNSLSVTLKSPDDELIMMRLKPEMDPDDLIGRLRMERMSTNDNLSRLLGSVPEIASAIALGQSFRVVMPPGVLGHLMTHVNNPALKGLKMTTVVSNGSTAGAAGLASMAGFVAPLLIWTVLSFITGQFFLTQIQRNTQAIFEELRNILYFLVAKEESDLRARVEFLQYVSANFHALSQNDEMRHATLVNLQKTNLDSLSGLKLWVFHVEKELQEICDAVQLVKQGKDKRGNAEKVAGLVGTTRQNITRAITSWQCYALGSTLEIQLGQAFEPSLLEYTKQSLRKQSLDLRNALGKAENIWSDFKNISYFSESAKFELGKIHAVGEELAGYSNRVKESLISATKYLISIEDLESRGTGLLYYNGAFYRPDQDAVLSMKASKSSESIMSGS